MKHLLEYFYGGIEGKCVDAPENCSWGGQPCMDRVPYEARVIERFLHIGTVVVLFFVIGVSSSLKKMYSEAELRIAEHRKNHGKPSAFTNLFNKFFSVLFMVMFVQIIFYKSNDKALLFALQPCHLMLVAQSIALWDDTPTGIMLSSFLLPTLMGTLCAILFPDTSGLDQPLEATTYWVQHYFIQSFPIYLLCRSNFLALKMASTRAIIIGTWFLMAYHWPILETLDSISLVNVNFMLCPTANMSIAFSALPASIMYPSYRTAMAILIPISSFCMAHVYKTISYIIRFIVGDSDKKKAKSN